MKTLVIHPQDDTTSVLKIVYENHINDWTIITDPNISNKNLKNLIKNHDRIIIMGHGSPNGLFNPNMGGFLIDSSFVYLLREKKENVYIWCNADEFVKKYKLKGFTTGMIISEENEAIYCKISATLEEINKSIILFSESIRDSINESSKIMCENVIRDYNSDNNSDVLNFNRSRIYHF